MVSFYNPEHEGADSKRYQVNRLYSMSEASWIPKEAADHILQAAQIIDKTLRSADHENVMAEIEISK